MVSNFFKDLKKGKKGERIAKDVLECMTENYTFRDVSEEEEYRHLGDIEIKYSYDSYREKFNVKPDYLPMPQELFDLYNLSYFIDVKDDSRIGDTGNILCEEKVYYKKNGIVKDGFMYNLYDYLAIVNEKDKMIYILDFHLLQKVYKQGRKMRLYYSDQYSDVYLYSLDKAKDNGILMAVIGYEEDRGYYYPTDLLYKKDNLVLNTF